MIHYNLGGFYEAIGRTKEAEAADKEALAVRKTLAERHPEVPEYRQRLPNSYSRIGALYWGTGRTKKAELQLRKLLPFQNPGGEAARHARVSS